MSNILILDGGLGTTLEQDHHVKFSVSTPLWSSNLVVSDPDTLLACQKSFGDVPVDIILTATYQASIEGFAKTKTERFSNGIDKASIPAFIDDAVSIAESAKHADAKVALSVGPYGACMIPSQEYTGKYDAAHDSLESLRAWHIERLQVFAQVPKLAERVSFIAVETIPRVDEIIAVRQAIDAIPQLHGVRVWISCLYPGEEVNGTYALPDCTKSADAVLRAMLDPSLVSVVPWAVGVNCTKVWKLDVILRGYEAAISQLLDEELAKEWPALVLYPDGTNGEVYNTETQKWELPGDAKTESRESWDVQLAGVVSRTQERGEWPSIVVGGCCMSKPGDISKLRGRCEDQRRKESVV